jgi:hypothetical protein
MRHAICLLSLLVISDLEVKVGVGPRKVANYREDGESLTNKQQRQRYMRYGLHPGLTLTNRQVFSVQSVPLVPFGH